MTGKDLYHVINNIDDTFILEADETVTFKKNAVGFSWKRFTGIAACIALVIGVSVILPKFLPTLIPGKEAPQEKTANAILNDYVDIYYLENGTAEIKKESVKLDYTPQNIFQEWKKMNNIPGSVSLVDYRIDSNGHEQSGNSSTATYVVGDVYTLNVALSDEFTACLTKSNRTALLKSLEKTLSYQKIKFQSVNIIVGGQKINP